MPYQTAEGSATLESIAQDQREDLRAIRRSLESMEKLLKDIYDITEAKAQSFARRNTRGVRAAKPVDKEISR
jgi:hypothetical protein